MSYVFWLSSIFCVNLACLVDQIQSLHYAANLGYSYKELLAEYHSDSPWWQKIDLGMDIKNI